MNEVALQTLLMLAFLAIGLISVTFPIYAICVTYLPRELKETEKERKKRREQLKAKIADLTAKLSGEEKDSEDYKEMKKQIRIHETELDNLEIKVSFLTAKGAVRDPIITLFVGLAASLFGVYFYYENSFFYAFASGVFAASLIGLGILFLYKTISIVEQAAIRPARTVEFIVSCGKLRQKCYEIKAGKASELSISVGTDDEDVENISIGIFIPPEMKIVKLPRNPHIHVTLQEEGFQYSNYTKIGMEQEFVQKGVSLGVTFSVLVEEIGTYQIPISVFGKGINIYRDVVTLNVV
jgi:hypothetical protein